MSRANCIDHNGPSNHQLYVYISVEYVKEINYLRCNVDFHNFYEIRCELVRCRGRHLEASNTLSKMV